MLVWYAAYGSNLGSARFAYYLSGGQPVGARRAYPGARDTRAPRRDRPLRLSGQLRFGGESLTWGGGIAFYEPGLAPLLSISDPPPRDAAEPAGGAVLARAYLITAEQFADVASQEMRRAPGGVMDLAPVLQAGRHGYGGGHYETVLHLGDLDGHPVLTFTADDPDALAARAPGRRYLQLLGAGLSDAHGLDHEGASRYLAQSPQIRDAYPQAELRALLQEGSTTPI